MTASRTTSLWRSKLRRLHRLNAWKHSDGDHTSGELDAQAPDVGEAFSPKRRRVAADRHNAAKDARPVYRSSPLEISRGDHEQIIRSPPSCAVEGTKRKFEDSVGTVALCVLAKAACNPTSRARIPDVTRVHPQRTSVDTTPKQTGASSVVKLDAATEIKRILAAEEPESLLGLRSVGGAQLSDECVTQTWKLLVLLLHPDKLHRLPEQVRADGAEALHRVHKAKEELRRRSQAICAEVPPQPILENKVKYLELCQGKRKFEISWVLPESQDPGRPIENYEVWGPLYFSENGDPYDWVLLATLPTLQSSFVLVEEAPTQQDVMWAADRVLRPTLPVNVYAVNGRGQSEALTFDVPWATDFPWLSGTPSVVCTVCFRMCPCTGPLTKCPGCNARVSSESRISLRCPECQGVVLWARGSNVLRCTCCLRVSGEDCGQQSRPGTKPSHTAPPQMKPWEDGYGSGRAPHQRAHPPTQLKPWDEGYSSGRVPRQPPHPPTRRSASNGHWNTGRKERAW